MSLTERLKEKRDATIAAVPADKLVVIKASTDELVANQIAEKALKKGQKLPSFSLNNAKGEKVNSDDLLANSKLIVSFYRGGWCPYCNMELSALQSHLSEFKELGAELVAITPEAPDSSLSTSEKNELEFHVLSDIDNTYAKELKLTFQMPEDLQTIYNEFGIDVAKHNGNQDFELPMPATYVVDKSGEILHSFVSEDYTVRLDPETILEVLKK